MTERREYTETEGMEQNAGAMPPAGRNVEEQSAETMPPADRSVEGQRAEMMPPAGRNEEVQGEGAAVRTDLELLREVALRGLLSEADCRRLGVFEVAAAARQVQPEPRAALLCAQEVVPEQLSAAQIKFLSDHRVRLQKIRCIQILILVLFLALWEVTTRLSILNAFIFSSPSRILISMAELLRDGSLLMHIGVTLAETFVSFFFIVAIGIGMAVLLWWNDMLAKILEPYLVILNSLPKSALAPVFIVWLGNNMKTIIVAAVSVAVFGAVLTIYTAFMSVEEDKKKLIMTLGGTKRDILCKVVIPSNIPAIISVMKVNIGLALVGVIIGEFLAANAGLGYLIIYGSQVFKLDWVLMSIVILCVLASILYRGIAWLERRFS